MILFSIEIFSCLFCFFSCLILRKLFSADKLIEHIYEIDKENDHKQKNGNDLNGARNVKFKGNSTKHAEHVFCLFNSDEHSVELFFDQKRINCFLIQKKAVHK